MMHTIFKDVKGVCYFQDDILIHANSQSEHDQILRTVLSKLRHHGLIVNKDKCRFGQTSVDYLGHTITPDGITPKKELVRAITDAPAPEGKDQLRSFLGLCKYISKFVRDFATKVAPLRSLMKKDVPFKWETQHQKVFNELKRDIAERQVLRRIECSDAVETVLTTDASCYGLGGVLTQIAGGEERIIAFVSRTLSDAEKNYSVIEKEMLACFWATKRLR